MRTRTVVAVISMAVGGAMFGSGLWIQAKAIVAQGLLEFAWSQTVVSGRPFKPWPWADHWPVARLIFPSQDKEYIVLRGDSGSSLAFAPGWNLQSAAPGDSGVTMISAHRDTHFRVLEGVVVGERITLINSRGRGDLYRVVSLDVVDSRDGQIFSDDRFSQLLLVTCYPFDALIAGGPLRYVVRAEHVI